jgi:hypothetical protein
MGLILRSIEGIPKMQFSLTHKFMLQRLRRCDVKFTEKTALTKFHICLAMPAEN